MNRYLNVDNYFKSITKLLNPVIKHAIISFESEMKHMRKLALALILALLLAAIPSVSFTEDTAAVRLARTIYALAADESYETKLALGSVVMNRVDSGWFPNDLHGVLSQQQQFPAGRRYDDDSLRAAHAVLSGKRTLNTDALYYQAADAPNAWAETTLCRRVGNYNFYYLNGND